jgi:hypothetical protein
MDSTTSSKPRARTRAKALFVALLVAGVALGALPACTPAGPTQPFPKHATYASGTLRPTGFTQAQQDGHVRTFYDYWKSQYVVDAGGNPKQYRIAFGAPGSADHARTVSEGQGYGMMIVAHMAGHDAAARAVFDGLFRFFEAHPSDIDGRLMGFLTPPEPGANNSAFDGDADIAYALLLADKQWGSTGAVNYRAEATTLLAGVLGSTVGPQSRLPMLGDWLSPSYAVNGARYNQWAPRTSDLLPGHFAAFQRSTTGATATTWGTVTANSRAVVKDLQARFSPSTGLLPDFTAPENLAACTDSSTATVCRQRPAPIHPTEQKYLEDAGDDDFDYNACRDPWRLATDALVNGNADSKAAASKMSEWARVATGGNPTAIRAGYTLQGSPLPGTDYFSTAFVAPLAVAAMTGPSQSWLNSLYGAVRNARQGYYEDSINLLSLLVLTGNWWDPTRV